MRLRWLLAAALLAPASGDAHESHYAYLRLRVVEAEISGEWEIYLRDARIVLGLPSETGGESAWRELRSHADALAGAFREAFAIRTDAGACPLAFEPGLTRLAGREYALLRFRARCPGSAAGILHLGYRLLFDADPQHRGFFVVVDERRIHAGVFTADEREVTVDVRQPALWSQLVDYLREGVRHIGIGTDHVLFLLALLLPAPLRRSEERWEPRESLPAVAREVAAIVTAFTVAHSVTLALAVFGVRPLGTRWIEALIAVSVFAAAWNNVHPFATRRPWAMAFGFGLVHGFGFAAALAELGLPPSSRGVALLGFNLGVEAGQLALVAAVLPLLFRARGTRAYRVLALRGGSLAIAWVATLWTIERLFRVDLLPFL